MSEDLRDLLQRAEPVDGPPPSLPAIVGRGRRLARTRLAVAVGAVAVVALAVPVTVPRVLDAMSSDAVAPAGEASPAPNDQPEEIVEIALDGPPSEVVTTESDVWVVHSDGRGGFALARVSAATNEVADQVEVAGLPIALDYQPPFVWVLVKKGSDGGEVVRVDAATGEVETPSVSVPVEPLDMEVGADAAWVTGIDGAVYEIDLEQSTARAVDATGHFLAADGDDLWAATIEGSIVSIADDGSAELVGDVGPNVVGLDAMGDRLWLTQQLPSGGLRVAALNRDGTRAGPPEVFPSGPGALAAEADRAWIVVDRPGNRDALVAVSARGGAPAEVEVGKGPVAVAIGEGDVWVANFESATLSRVARPE